MSVAPPHLYCGATLCTAVELEQGGALHSSTLPFPLTATYLRRDASPVLTPHSTTAAAPECPLARVGAAPVPVPRLTTNLTIAPPSLPPNNSN
jgi:hypothetical protein